LQQNRKVYHLDTNYLIYYFQNEAKVLSEIKQKYEKDNIKKAGDVVTRLISNGAELRISLIALGELIFLFMKEQERKENKTHLKFDFICKKLQSLNFILWSPQKEDLFKVKEFFNEIVNEKKEEDGFKDSYVKGSEDYLLIAMAYADKESNGFLTFDNDLINDDSINKFIENKNQDSEFRKRGFVITSDPG